MKVESVTVLAKIDGKMCLLPIDQQIADMFVRMIAPFQGGSGGVTKAIALPPQFVEIDLGKQLVDYALSVKAGGPKI